MIIIISCNNHTKEDDIKMPQKLDIIDQKPFYAYEIPDTLEYGKTIIGNHLFYHHVEDDLKYKTDCTRTVDCYIDIYKDKKIMEIPIDSLPKTYSRFFPIVSENIKDTILDKFFVTPEIKGKAYIITYMFDNASCSTGTGYVDGFRYPFFASKEIYVK